MRRCLELLLPPFLTPISLPAGQEKGASHPGCGAQHTSGRDQNSEVRKPSFWTLVGGWGGLGLALLDPTLRAYSPHGLCSSAHIRLPSRSLLMFTMENCFYLLISQAMRYLRDPAVHPRDKQRMKQELSSELVGGVEGPACWGDPEVPAPHCQGGHRASSGASSLAEHSPLQPLPLLPPGSPQLPCCWRSSLASGQVHLSVQGQPRESGASDPAGIS